MFWMSNNKVILMMWDVSSFSHMPFSLVYSWQTRICNIAPPRLPLLSFYVFFPASFIHYHGFSSQHSLMITPSFPPVQTPKTLFPLLLMGASLGSCRCQKPTSWPSLLPLHYSLQSIDPEFHWFYFQNNLNILLLFWLFTISAESCSPK